MATSCAVIPWAGATGHGPGRQWLNKRVVRIAFWPGLPVPAMGLCGVAVTAIRPISMSASSGNTGSASSGPSSSSTLSSTSSTDDKDDRDKKSKSQASSMGKGHARDQTSSIARSETMKKPHWDEEHATEAEADVKADRAYFRERTIPAMQKRTIEKLAKVEAEKEGKHKQRERVHRNDKRARGKDEKCAEQEAAEGGRSN